MTGQEVRGNDILILLGGRERREEVKKNKKSGKEATGSFITEGPQYLKATELGFICSHA